MATETAEWAEALKSAPRFTDMVVGDTAEAWRVSSSQQQPSPGTTVTPPALSESDPPAPAVTPVCRLLDF
jgi:hypothetical protein